MHPTPTSHKASHRPPRIEPADERERKFEVICKVRPLQHAESSEDITIGENSPTITIFNHPKNSSKEFTFHRVYGQSTRQSHFSRCLSEEILMNCRQNEKGCLVLSYGVTNSGKTFTIFGNSQEPGILPALIRSIQGSSSNSIRIRAVQIYNDVIYCLRTGRELQWSDSKCIDECEFEEIGRENTDEVLTSYIRKRRTDETHANQTSSRSHAIFMVEWDGLHVAIADLAGNEKYGSNANFNETVKINENLLVLGQCISAFRDGEFIPYRRSRLTQVLMEYFKPSYKIYMIAHLNRSGQMFHQNVNVLQYAAVSTQIKHLHANLKKNPSIAKSLRKKDRLEQPEASQRKPEMGETQRRQNKFLLERYKCYIMGVNAQAQSDLDEYFKRQDQKDKRFLEELKASQFVSPTKDRRLWLNKLEAESRIKLRQIFLDDMKREQMEKQAECGVGTTQSLAKNYHEKDAEVKHQEKKGVDYGSMMGTSIKKLNSECHHRHHHHSASEPSSSIPIPADEMEESIVTPLKPPSSFQSESYLRRIMKNPALMIQSGYRMISNINQVASHMMDTFKGLIGQQPTQQQQQVPPKQLNDIKKDFEKISDIVLPPGSGKKIVIIGDPLVEIPQMKIVKKQSIQAQLPGGQHVDNLEQKKEEKSKVKVQAVQIVQAEEIEFKDEEPRPAANSENNIPFDSQESTILVNQDFRRSSQNPSEEETKNNQHDENILAMERIQDSSSEKFPSQTINTVNINILVNNIHNQPVEDSLLLNDFQSEKELSTNRSSDVDLLRSESSIKNQLQPIESIPEQAENQTTSKPVISCNPESKEAPYLTAFAISSSKQGNLAVVHPNIHMEAKLNETGLKSTQETFIQRSNSIKSKSVSVHSRSNTHTRCAPKENMKYYKKVHSKVKDISGIKTRNMRKNRSNDARSPKGYEVKDKKTKK